MIDLSICLKPGISVAQILSALIEEEEYEIMGILANRALVEKTVTLTGNNETQSLDVFRITGAVLIAALWGEVTANIGSNVTTTQLRLVYPTASLEVGLMSTGLALSNYEAGSIIIANMTSASSPWKGSRAGSPASLFPGSNNTGAFWTGITVTEDSQHDAKMVFRYATTNTPTSGAIKFRAYWEPLTVGASLVAA